MLFYRVNRNIEGSNISAILQSVSAHYDKRVRPNYGGKIFQIFYNCSDVLLVYSRLYTMRDVRELCVKTSKISKLCIVYRSWFASTRTWSYAHIVMHAISPRGGNFAHYQRKNLHLHFFWKCTLNLLTGRTNCE